MNEAEINAKAWDQEAVNGNAWARIVDEEFRLLKRGNRIGHLGQIAVPERFGPEHRFGKPRLRAQQSTRNLSRSHFQTEESNFPRML